jgi:predicted RNA-binding Zn-ribbon protein involved in translation (DUF1610 family)
VNDNICPVCGSVRIFRKHHDSDLSGSTSLVNDAVHYTELDLRELGDGCRCDVDLHECQACGFIWPRYVDIYSLLERYKEARHD